MKQIPKNVKVSGADRVTLSRAVERKYLSGVSVRTIAAECGRSYGFVHGLLAQAGVPFRQRGGSNKRG